MLNFFFLVPWKNDMENSDEYLAFLIIGIFPEQELIVGEKTPSSVPGSETADILEDGEEAALFDQTLRVTLNLELESGVNGRHERDVLQSPLLPSQCSRRYRRKTHQTETRIAHSRSARCFR